MDLELPICSEGLDEEAVTFASAVRAWVDRQLVARRATLGEDYQALLLPARRGLLLELGLQAHLWPESAGGDGASPAGAAMTLALALEELGRGDVGLGLVATCQLAVAAAIRGCGDQGAASLLCSREREIPLALVLPAVTPEPAPGRPTDAVGRPLQATARGEGDALFVDGEKTRPLGGGLDAAVFGVLCGMEPDRTALLLVPADGPGVHRGPPLRQTGLAAAPNAEVSFRGAPATLALEGPAALTALRSWICLGVAATCSGALLAGLRILGDWAGTRVIKGRGQRFVDNPLVAELIAGLVQRSTLTRIAVREAARLLARPAAGGELTVAAVAQHAARDTDNGLGQVMELMGSAGYATEWQLERYWRDCRSLRSVLGSAVLGRLELARQVVGHGGGA